ncbi:glycosyltransferase [Terrabacter sp. 2YAF2]|uniref:glycosyltransferase n=1 Tax=Terrabacter sp. 2YAF2 TaxID=3233026 RepID=UPI003F94FB0C
MLTVTYGDRGEFLEQTLNDAIGSGASSALVIINGPCGDLTHLLRSNWGIPIDFLQISRNTGSAGGYAAGLTWLARHGRAQWIWCLDDDNSCDPDTLSRLLIAAKQHDSSAVLSMRSEPHLERASKGAPFPVPGSFLSFDVIQRIRGDYKKLSDSALPRQIPYAPYGGLLFKASLLQVVGVPDASLVLYEDDTEYTYRFTRAGIPILLVPDAFVEDQEAKWHAHDQSRPNLVFSENSIRQYYSVRNRTAFDTERARAHGTISQARLLINMITYSVASIAAHWPRRNRHQLMRFLAAVADGLRGKRGVRRADVLQLAEWRGEWEMVK